MLDISCSVYFLRHIVEESATQKNQLKPDYQGIFVRKLFYFKILANVLPEQ